MYLYLPNIGKEEEVGGEVDLVKEEDRLAITIDNICQDVAVVPRGAYMRTPLGEVLVNRTFAGW